VIIEFNSTLTGAGLQPALADITTAQAHGAGPSVSVAMLQNHATPGVCPSALGAETITTGTMKG